MHSRMILKSSAAREKPCWTARGWTARKGTVREKKEAEPDAPALLLSFRKLQLQIFKEIAKAGGDSLRLRQLEGFLLNLFGSHVIQHFHA